MCSMSIDTREKLFEGFLKSDRRKTFIVCVHEKNNIIFILSINIKSALWPVCGFNKVDEHYLLTCISEVFLVCLKHLTYSPSFICHLVYKRQN